jgi:hypothetical protein
MLIASLRPCDRRKHETWQECRVLGWRVCEEWWEVLEDTPFGPRVALLWEAHVWTNDEWLDRLEGERAAR